MPKSKPLQPADLKTLIGKVDTLLNLGIVTKDFVVNSEEAALITGLSPETIRRYGRFHHLPVIQYAGRNMYPLKALCEFVDRHYHSVTIVNTSEMNGYKGVKMGRPKNGKGV
ncbi:hypothetical protein AGMMS50268_38470 [Spirochaetia bacterium]|nr:hypothetical protein AGMMS50268_38470 [Spirochaetia bacterium]